MRNVIIALLVLGALNVSAQSTPQHLLDKFFAAYKENAGQAVQDLYATNEWTMRKKDDIDHVVGTVNSLTETYVGAYYGYELITTKKFADSFQLYSYLVKYDRQPIRFVFKFYKPNDKWILYSFSLDDELDDEIEEAAKLYYLDLN